MLIDLTFQFSSFSFVICSGVCGVRICMVQLYVYFLFMLNVHLSIQVSGHPPYLPIATLYRFLLEVPSAEPMWIE